MQRDCQTMLSAIRAFSMVWKLPELRIVLQGGNCSGWNTARLESNRLRAAQNHFAAFFVCIARRARELRRLI